MPGKTYVAVRPRIGDLFPSTRHFPSIWFFFALKKDVPWLKILMGAPAFIPCSMLSAQRKELRSGFGPRVKTVPISQWSVLRSSFTGGPHATALTHLSLTAILWSELDFGEVKTCMLRILLLLYEIIRSLIVGGIICRYCMPTVWEMNNQYFRRDWDAYFEFGNVGVDRDELPESWLSAFGLLDFILELIVVFGLDKDPNIKQ